MGRMDGKRVLITGASSGIGTAVAEMFAERGADLALIARGDGLAEAGRRARMHGVEAHEIHADVAKRPELRRAIRGAITALGGLDVAILNAGAGVYGPFDELRPSDFDQVMNVTFRGTVDATRLVLPALERSGGTIVITGSVAGKVPFPLMSAYTAAKHAVRGFAGSLRMELAATGSPVRIAMVHPGPVDTPFWEHTTTPAGRKPIPLHGAYSVQSVARGIVGVAERPRRELTIGGAMLAWELFYGLARPIAEPLLARVVGKVAQAEKDEDANEGQAGGLHEPSGDGEEEGGIASRPSLWAELALAPGRLLRVGR